MRVHLPVYATVFVLLAQAVSGAPIHDAVAAGDMARVKQILRLDPKQIRSGEYAAGCIITGDKPLHIAAQHNRLEIAKYLLSKGVDVNVKNGSGETPLHKAGSREIAALLISHGANFNARDRRHQTPIYNAALYRKKDVVKLLLQCKAKVETIDEAVLVGDRTKVEAMLSADPSLLNKKRTHDPSLLGCAVMAGNYDMMRLLISRGVDVNAVHGYDKDSALHIAAECDDVDAAQILISAGARIDISGSNDATPLHIAAWKDCKEVASLLIANGADPNAKSDNDLTPLHEAVRYGHTEFARLLVNAGADVNARTKFGTTPLHYAASENLDVVMLVVEHGADVNAVTDDGLSPLTYSELKMIADYLVSKGAKPQNCFDYALLGDVSEMERTLKEHPEIINESPMWGRRTPIYHAIIGDSLPMVEFLISKRADVNVRDVSGVTPLGLAKRLGRVEIAKVLRGHWAR